MPFDVGTFPTETTNDTYRERREGAAKLWARVPKEVFCMTDWQCGGAACALGWLAISQYDGWKQGEISSHGRWPLAPDGKRGCTGAAGYFGISLAEAMACFGGDKTTARYHGRWWIERVTPADVARKLLALPYPEGQ